MSIIPETVTLPIRCSTVSKIHAPLVNIIVYELWVAALTFIAFSISLWDRVCFHVDTIPHSEYKLFGSLLGLDLIGVFVVIVLFCVGILPDIIDNLPTFKCIPDEEVHE